MRASWSVASAHLLLAAPAAAAEWWPGVRCGTVRMVSLGAEEGAADRQFLARLWRAGVEPGRIALEELSALLCWQPARLLGLPAKGRLHPGCDADLAVLDPEAPVSLVPAPGISGLSMGPWWTIRAGAWRDQGCSCSASWIRSRIAWFRARL